MGQEAFSERSGGNAVQSILAALDRQMFPGGEVEEMQQVSDLYDLFGGKYGYKDVSVALRFVLSSLFLSEKKDVVQVISAVVARKGNVFSEEDARRLVAFAIDSNERLSLRVSLTSHQ